MVTRYKNPISLKLLYSINYLEKCSIGYGIGFEYVAGNNNCVSPTLLS